MGPVPFIKIPTLCSLPFVGVFNREVQKSQAAVKLRELKRGAAGTRVGRITTDTCRSANCQACQAPGGGTGSLGSEGNQPDASKTGFTGPKTMNSKIMTLSKRWGKWEHVPDLKCPPCASPCAGHCEDQTRCLSAGDLRAGGSDSSWGLDTHLSPFRC